MAEAWPSVSSSVTRVRVRENADGMGQGRGSVAERSPACAGLVQSPALPIAEAPGGGCSHTHAHPVKASSAARVNQPLSPSALPPSLSPSFFSSRLPHRAPQVTHPPGMPGHARPVLLPIWGAWHPCWSPGAGTPPGGGGAQVAEQAQRQVAGPPERPLSDVLLPLKMDPRGPSGGWAPAEPGSAALGRRASRAPCDKLASSAGPCSHEAGEREARGLDWTAAWAGKGIRGPSVLLGHSCEAISSSAR